MFTFCDVLHEAKQKNINKISRVHSTVWKSALNQPTTTLSDIKQSTPPLSVF